MVLPEAASAALYGSKWALMKACGAVIGVSLGREQHPNVLTAQCAHPALPLSLHNTRGPVWAAGGGVPTGQNKGGPRLDDRYEQAGPVGEGWG